jgi:hypothetical protein
LLAKLFGQFVEDPRNFFSELLMIQRW